MKDSRPHRDDASFELSRSVTRPSPSSTKSIKLDADRKPGAMACTRVSDTPTTEARTCLSCASSRENTLSLSRRTLLLRREEKENRARREHAYASPAPLSKRARARGPARAAGLGFVPRLGLDGERALERRAGTERRVPLLDLYRKLHSAVHTSRIG